jgi:hypothetical protein
MISSNNLITYKPKQEGFIVKIKYTLIPAVLIIVLALIVVGKNNHGGTTKTDMKKHNILSMMVKPIVDAKVEGLYMKVRLMTQKQHKRIMKEEMERMAISKMKDTSLGIDKATKKAMMIGTHYIMLEITDSTSGKDITDATAKVLIEYPSKKNWSNDLKPMMGHFGNGLTLNEKGEYKFKVVVIVNGVPKSKQFNYTVK